MNRLVILLNFFIVSTVYSITVEDFIIQDSNFPNRYRQKIFLGQPWKDDRIQDVLVKIENLDQWSGYKDVIIYYYENIEIITARIIPSASYREVVDISIIGKKFSTTREMIIGNTKNEMISIYGKPQVNIISSGYTYFGYKLNNPYSDWGGDTQQYSLLFTLENDIITKITVHYIHNT
ncbi:hypothetical protein FACS189450_13640 [Spirochaetia bacterium]|nr:hypothetical protein FACS189450_13640 [Spirochaetia bacterium]